MAGRGLFLALDDLTLKQLRATKGDAARRNFIHELEEVIDPQYKQDTDKAWEFLFVALFTGRSSCDIPQVDALAMATVYRGAKQLFRGDSYIINWLHKDAFPPIAAKFKALTPDCLRERYDTLNQGWFHAGVYKGNDEQFAYILGWHERIQQFFERMHTTQRHILFTSSYN